MARIATVEIPQGAYPPDDPAWRWQGKGVLVNHDRRDNTDPFRVVWCRELQASTVFPATWLRGDPAA